MVHKCILNGRASNIIYYHRYWLAGISKYFNDARKFINLSNDSTGRGLKNLPKFPLISGMYACTKAPADSDGGFS